MSTWSEETLARLEAGGHRRGGARRAVVELLGRQDCCLTAQEIFDALRAQGRTVGIASIYRVLELLGEYGLVQRIDVGAGTARYERSSPGGEHHHHLVCRGCGKVEAFEDEELESALDLVQAKTGFVAGHEVVLHGSCADCNA